MIKLIHKNFFYRKIYDSHLTTDEENREVLTFAEKNNSYETYSFSNLQKEFQTFNSNKIYYTNYMDCLPSVLDKIKSNDLESFKSLYYKLEKIFDKFLLRIVSCNKNYEELKKIEPLMIFGLVKNLDGSYSAFELSISFIQSYFWDISFNIEINFAELNYNL